MKVGDKIWYCSKLDALTNGVQYGIPKEIKTRLRYFTVMERSGAMDIIELGNQVTSYLTAVAQPYLMWQDVFKNGDLFYVNGATPSESERFYGQNANYIVDNVGYGNIGIKLSLKRVAKK